MLSTRRLEVPVHTISRHKVRTQCKQFRPVSLRLLAQDGTPAYTQILQVGQTDNTCHCHSCTYVESEFATRAISFAISTWPTKVSLDATRVMAPIYIPICIVFVDYCLRGGYPYPSTWH